MLESPLETRYSSPFATKYDRATSLRATPSSPVRLLPGYATLSSSYLSPSPSRLFGPERSHRTNLIGTGCIFDYNRPTSPLEISNRESSQSQLQARP
ncbi:unnamed protein product [Brassica napus]|uniref:(rape) hypothetical protein n=1 Tax=Brassica napus TaxID=3708 RepID=A0A816U659_BRANA|nr:unnamed protein product [Brassica napus]